LNTFYIGYDDDSIPIFICKSTSVITVEIFSTSELSTTVITIEILLYSVTMVLVQLTDLTGILTSSISYDGKSPTLSLIVSETAQS
jgi:hypothetical protein